jgi:hypothetical protein
MASSHLPVLNLVAATRENNSKRAALHEVHSAHASKARMLHQILTGVSLTM